MIINLLSGSVCNWMLTVPTLDLRLAQREKNREYKDKQRNKRHTNF